MPFLNVLLQAIIGVPSIMLVLVGFCGALWVPALVISKAFGLQVQSWGWALFGLPMMAIACIVMVAIGCFGTGLVDKVDRR